MDTEMAKYIDLYLKYMDPVFTMFNNWDTTSGRISQLHSPRSYSQFIIKYPLLPLLSFLSFLFFRFLFSSFPRFRFSRPFYIMPLSYSSIVISSYFSLPSVTIPRYTACAIMARASGNRKRALQLVSEARALAGNSFDDFTGMWSLLHIADEEI